MINISDTQQLKTSVTYYGTGSQTNFDFPFDYLRKSFIHVTINDVEVSDYSIDSRTVIFDTAPSEGAIINIYRSTDTARLVSWADASVLKASDMTIAQVQQLHILEEGQDWSKLNSIYLDENDSKWQGNNHPIKNVSDPVDAKDVVTKGYMETVQDGFIRANTALKDEATKQAGIATTKASEASASASAAKTSETNAASSENMAKRWAEASDSPDNTTSKSAKTWASEAAGSASAAKTSETNAKSSETTAVNSATTATEKASVATTKASEASASASAAKTSETNAASSATNAQNAAKEVKEIYGDGNFTPLSDLLGGLGTKLKRWGAIFANKVFASNLPIVYNNVAEMKADTMLWEGMNTKTLGYYKPNDGGGASYLIREKLEADADDAGSLHELANGLVAELIIENGTVNVKQFGAVGDGMTDDVDAIQKTINKQYNIFLPPNNIFKISIPLIIPNKMTMYGNGADIHYNDDAPTFVCLNGFCVINNETKLYLHGIKIKCGNSSTSENSIFMSGNGTISHSIIDNITVLNASSVFSCTIRGGTVISKSTFQNIEYFVRNETMFADMSVSDCYISGNKSKESYVFSTKNVATSMFSNCFFDYFVALIKYSEACFFSSTFDNCIFQYFFRLFISEINEQSLSNGAVFNGCRFQGFSYDNNQFLYELDIFQYPWGVHCAISNQLSAYINNISYIGCVFYNCDNAINIQGAGLATAIIMKGCSGNFPSIIFNPYNNPNNFYKYSYLEPLMDIIVEQLPTSPFYGQRVIIESTKKVNLYLSSNEWIEI